MARIEQLTAAQQARFAEFRDEWLEVGLSTAPVDRKRAEAGVVAAYAAAGLPAPALKIWLRSPLEGLIGTAFLRSGKKLRKAVRDQVGDQVGDQVRDQVWDQVGDQVRDQVDWTFIYGQHEAAWLAFYDYFGRVCGLEITKRLDGLAEVARSTGWWWPYAGAVILTDRPCRLERDERGRLHSATGGMAIEYRDGWGFYAWHGVRVPEAVIRHPETLKAKEILAEGNIEIRRVMIERLGADRFMQDAGAKVVASDKDQYGRPRRLLRVEVPQDEALVMVEVTNSTREPDGSFKNYMLRVPPDTKTPKEAVAWSFDVNPKEFAPLVES